ncbi:MAG: alpha/beta hydrolase-fold protein [Pseudomonadota bacterium]
MPLSTETHVALGLEQPQPVEVNGRSNLDIMKSLDHPGDAPYHPCPEAHPAEDVSEGTVDKHRDWDGSTIYRDTRRDLFIYRPADFDPARASRLMVFQDGFGYLSRNGAIRATRVLDTLHARGEITQTVGVFVNPGIPPGVTPVPGERNAEAMAQRSYEYDSLTPDYGNFLLEEVLPFVTRTHDITLSEQPDDWTICGISSGGICAFTAAWMHPDRFRRVLSHCGSFTAIRGGQNYPYLIRTTERKPLRVFLQSGENDAETLAGDWPLANKTIANALAYAGYDHEFVFGTGGHNLRHGGAIFADSLRWLWRDA